MQWQWKNAKELGFENLQAFLQKATIPNDGLNPYLWQALLGDAWGAWLGFYKKKWVVYWPLYIKKVGFLTAILQPTFVPYNGPAVWMPFQSNSDRLRLLFYVMEHVQKVICRSFFCAQKWQPAWQYWFPLLRNKRMQLYLGNTYVLYEPQVYHYKPSLRRQLKKSKEALFVEVSNPFPLFERLYKESRKKYFSSGQWQELKRLLERLPSVVKAIALQVQGENVGLVILLKGPHCSYYLAGVQNEKGKRVAALSALLHYSACHFAPLDFVGSSVANVERFFRSFGAQPRIYGKVLRNPWVLSWRTFMKQFFDL